jgi:manganese-dependent ADP-ribose/CDP-alcohol diphosphatase
MSSKHAKIKIFFLIIIISLLIIVIYKGDMNENSFKIDFAKPIVTFGLLTDIQYAEVENTLNYRKDRMRYYKNGINLIRQAVQYWHENMEENNFKFIIQLGDILDGKFVQNRENALSLVLNELNSDFKMLIPDFKLYHIWGNHEFYNYKRNELIHTELNSARLANPKVSKSANYYLIDLTNDIKIICLDFYEFSALGYDEDNDVYKEAISLLRKHNRNEDLNNNEGLKGFLKRFTALNAALNRKQMNWLVKELEILKKNKCKAIIIGHIPIHPMTSKNTFGLAWNYIELLDIFNRYSELILAYLSGHDHNGAFYKCKKTNIHYLTFPSILEAPPKKNSFATIKIFNDKIIIEGKGLVGDYKIIY